MYFVVVIRNADDAAKQIQALVQSGRPGNYGIETNELPKVPPPGMPILGRGLASENVERTGIGGPGWIGVLRPKQSRDKFKVTRSAATFASAQAAENWIDSPDGKEFCANATDIVVVA